MTISTPNYAIVAHAKGDVRVDERPEPQPAPDEAIVEIAYGGICGSDLHYWLEGAAGVSILRDPMVLGHEVSGTVVAAAADGSGPALGARVVAHPATPKDDGETPYPADRPNLSPAGTYLGSAAHHPHTDGAFARRVALPSRMLRELADGVDLRVAALAEPAGVAWHAIERAGDVRGRSALVIGCGPIGLLAIAVLKRFGAARITAADLQPHALELALRLGASDTVDGRDAEAIARVHADVVVESSGSVPGFANAVHGAVRGGTVVMLGLQRAGEVPAPLATAIARELTLVGSFRFNDELDDVVAALADGSLDVAEVVTHEFPARDVLEALEVARDASVSSKVLLRFED